MAHTFVLNRAILVMAHPDDEVLWASSLLAQAERIVFCFGDVGSQPSWSAGRRCSLREYPLTHCLSLEIPESEVFDSAAWPEPVETDYGLEVRLSHRSQRGFSETSYREAFGTLVSELRPLLSESVEVVTHSPWGEYGHEEHVQVFRAVAHLQREIGFVLWVPGYVSNKSYRLMSRYLMRLEGSPLSLPTDPALTQRLKALYSRHDCWTWFPDYVWPETEYFYRWRGGDENPGRPRPGFLVTMNHLSINWLPPVRSTLWIRFRSLSKRLRVRLSHRLSRSQENHL